MGKCDLIAYRSKEGVIYQPLEKNKRRSRRMEWGERMGKFTVNATFDSSKYMMLLTSFLTIERGKTGHVIKWTEGRRRAGQR